MCFEPFTYPAKDWVFFWLNIYKNTYTKVEIICKEHGVFEQLPQNHLRGHGCPMCKRTLGESKIFDFLNKNDIIVEEQKKFEGLKFKSKLKCDFYLPEKNLVIEYNGIQHYKWIKAFDKTRKELLESRHRDWLKRDFCRKNGINFLVIPYWELNNIEKILTDKLNI